MNFNRMMADASKRKFDNVLFWAFDRFSREGIEATLSYIRRLGAYKVGFRSYQEPFFDSAGPFSEFIISAFATFASLERARISERTLAGLAKAKANGKVLGRPRTEDDLKLMKCFRELKESGRSIRAIVAEMSVSPTTVQKLLKAVA